MKFEHDDSPRLDTWEDWKNLFLALFYLVLGLLFLGWLVVGVAATLIFGFSGLNIYLFINYFGYKFYKIFILKG